jgi:ubiquitin-activating enzyme E1
MYVYSIPICTLKNFPNKIEHTIQWARDTFEGDFKQAPEEVNQYIGNPRFLEEIRKRPNEVLGTLGNVKVTTILSLNSYRSFMISLIRLSTQSCLVTQRARTFDDCVAWARLQFQGLFHNTILQLLNAFPSDHMIGTPPQPFWSGPKRPPVPLVFDEKDPAHMEFIIAASSLRAYNFGIKSETDEAIISAALAKVVVPAFVIDSSVKVAANDSEYKTLSEAAPDDSFETKVKNVTDTLPTPASQASFKMIPVEFEKVFLSFNTNDCLL